MLCQRTLSNGNCCRTNWVVRGQRAVTVARDRCQVASVLQSPIILPRFARLHETFSRMTDDTGS